jgi:hypothetical protein
LDLLLFRIAPIQQERATKNLTHFGTNKRREFFRNVVTIVWTLGPDAYFHEFVLLKSRIERGNNSIGEAEFANLDERIKVMSERSQVSSLFSRKAHDVPAGDRDRRSKAFRSRRLVF